MQGRQLWNGFTLVELLVVLAIIALLLTVASPRYFGSLQKAKEESLRFSLKVMRQSIDDFMADRGRPPKGLEELVQERYLREVPSDPISMSRSGWRYVSLTNAGLPNVYSTAPGMDTQGNLYSEY